MIKSHERFYSKNGKRLILIVDDQQISRELLELVLKDNYQIVTAADGDEALEMIEHNHTVLSLVILDLIMPKVPGLEVLKKIKADERLKHLPVIVLTADKSAEVESLNMGASDFITKPFEAPEVIRARVQRTIELAEDTVIIENTERDELTGLLNKEFFFRFAEQYRLYHQNSRMDAAVIDINNFHLVNEIKGRSYGDEVLRRIGSLLMDIVTDRGGIAGRDTSDTFLVYLPHGADYDVLHKVIMNELAPIDPETTVRVRVGIYEEAPKEELEIVRCFDRAKSAGSEIRRSYTKFVSVYDNALQEQELLSQRLINEMQTAIDERQFVVYYQPKYDITGDEPVLISAEALIRWNHPEMGMVRPDKFIKLFEENGLIQKLDRFVWEEAASQIAKWREKFGKTIPVSVNISRIDMYNPELVSNLLGLTQRYGVAPKDFLLEITESAYTKEAEQLISIVRSMRENGFSVEMDDFGSGYSSLNMLADMPLDVLKLDMRFVHSIGVSQKNLRMVELVMEIAKYLDVMVVAEGVENEEQLRELKRLGCGRVQGYYFSKPLTVEEFEKLIV